MSNLKESQMRIEVFLFELNLRRKKWFLCCSYNPKYSQISHHLSEVRSSRYDIIFLMADFNAEPTGTALLYFCEIDNLKR